MSGASSPDLSLPPATRAAGARRELSLRALLTLLTFVLSALGAGTLAVLRSAQIERQAQAEAGALNLQQAVGVAAAVDTDLGRFGSELLAQAQLIEESGALRQPALLQALMNGLQALPSHAWVGATDAQGKVLAATAGRLVGSNVSGREWWGAAQDGLYFGDVHQTELLERLLPALQAGEPWRFIDVSAPLREDGRWAGVVALHLSWPWLRERIGLFAQALPARDAQLFIVGRDGRQRLGPTGAVGDALPLQHLADEAPRGWRVLDWPDGRRCVTAWATHPGSPPFGGFGWVTLVRTPLPALALEHAGLRRGIWGAAALAVALATALAWLSSSAFLRLLGRFLERVHRIAEGAPVPPLPRRLPAELARIDQVVLDLVARLHGRAARADEAQGRFVTNMSHEIRTPLNAVIGLSQLLARMELPPQARRYAREIEQAGQQLLALAGGVLDLSRLQDGSARLRHEDFELRPLLEAACAAVAPQARHKRLALRLEAAPALPPRLRGDAARLRQLLDRLLGNGVKFTDHGGVTLRVRHAAQAAGRVRLEIEVSDTGIGIAAEAQARIFEDFTQLDGSRTRRHGGAGLGLALARRTAALMGGTLALDSAPGRGSTFRLSLPFDEAA